MLDETLVAGKSLSAQDWQLLWNAHIFLLNPISDFWLWIMWWNSFNAHFTPFDSRKNLCYLQGFLVGITYVCSEEKKDIIMHWTAYTVNNAPKVKCKQTFLNQELYLEELYLYIFTFWKVSITSQKPANSAVFVDHSWPLSSISSDRWQKGPSAWSHQGGWESPPLWIPNQQWVISSGYGLTN